MTKIRSITKLLETLLYFIYLFIYYVNIQNVSSSRLYRRLQSVNGLLRTHLADVDSIEFAIIRSKPSLASDQRRPPRFSSTLSAATRRYCEYF